MRIEVEWAGRVDYATAWQRQKAMVKAQASAGAVDQLLLLEHPPTYTLGRGADKAHLLYDGDTLQRRGIAVYEVDRGGDITYHGPGQLVGYPILNLRRLAGRDGRTRPDLHRYLRRLEQMLIDVLAEFGITGWRHAEHTGVWVTTPDGPGKIAAIGVRVNVKGISSHGFALNVAPDMSHFEGIVPCGIGELGVTSLAEMLGDAIDLTTVVAPVVLSFVRTFNLEPEWVAPLAPIPA